MSTPDDSEKHQPRPGHFVFVGPAHPYRGGIAHFLEHLASGLQRRSGLSTIVTFKRQYPDFLFPGKTQLVEEVDGPATQRLLDSINPLSWRSVARRIIEMKPDVVVFQHWTPFLAPAFGYIARKVQAAGAKVVVIVHNAIPHERHLGDVALTRYFLGSADGLIAMSKSVKADLETRVKVTANVQLIPHPVYDNFGPSLDRKEARDKLGIDPNNPVLLFFGFIRKYKGLDTLLDALPAVKQALPGVKLVVAGEFYDDEEKYREQVQRHDLDAAVTFRSNYIPDSDVGKYFSACDLVVQPYRTATQSGVAQIAFQFDRPVVVTNVGGLSEIVPDGEAGFVVPPEDPDQLAKAIIRYFVENRTVAMTTAVRVEKLKYTWDRMYETIEQFARVDPRYL